MRKMCISQAATDNYMILQDISIENHRDYNGNLSFTFFGMLELLTHKHGITPYVFTIRDEHNNHLAGYCILYFTIENSIQISQICLRKTYQNQGIGKYFLDFFEKVTITADIAFENQQSQRFFTKNGFALTKKENKEYYQAERKI